MKQDLFQIFSRELLPMYAALAALVFLYLPFLVTLAGEWDSNENYSHGWFIPAIFLYMVWCLREKLAAEPMRTAPMGLVVLVAGLVLLLAGKVGSEHFMQRTAFILSFAGILYLFLGWRRFRLLVLPVLYLFFMVPLPAIIWNKTAFPLQLFGSMLTEQVVRLFGIPVYREGNILHLVETTLEVVAACSGLRSLVTMFAMAGLLAFVTRMALWKRLFLFVCAAPVALMVNIVRLSVTALLASRYGGQVAQGFLHDLSGYVVFILGIIILLGISTLLQRRSEKRGEEDAVCLQ